MKGIKPRPLSVGLDYQTGDLLLLKSSPNCCPWEVRSAPFWSFNRIGVILQNFGPIGDGTFVIEYSDGPTCFKARIRPIDDVINDWEGVIYYRRLTCNRNNDFYRVFEDVFEKSKTNFTVNNAKDDLGISYLHSNPCSLGTNNGGAFVAYLYYKLNLIHTTSWIDDVFPNDFGRNSRKIVLREDNKLSDLCKVDFHSLLFGF